MEGATATLIVGFMMGMGLGWLIYGPGSKKKGAKSNDAHGSNKDTD